MQNKIIKTDIPLMKGDLLYEAEEFCLYNKTKENDKN